MFLLMILSTQKKCLREYLINNPDLDLCLYLYLRSKGLDQDEDHDRDKDL